MQERIVCAANKGLRTATTILGVRHYDAFMSEQRSMQEPEQQGFITNKGRFVSRTEAWKIAEASGQIIRRVGGDDANGGTLYSENLY